MSDNKTTCFACRHEIKAGERVKVQHGAGPDGGGLHLKCWVELEAEPDYLRGIMAMALRRLTEGECEPAARAIEAAMILQKGLL